MNRLKSKPYDKLELDELFDIFQLRQDVFIIEQNCPYPDIDNFDKDAIHLMLYESGNLVSYARILDRGTSYKEFCSIGRVVTKKEYRGRQFGELVMREAIKIAKAKFGLPIKISAQVYITGFYEKLGFKKTGKSYLEDDIPHIGMVIF